MKKLFWVLPLVAILAGCSPEEPGNYRADLQVPGKLRVGMAIPYYVFAQSDPLRGIDVELAEALGRELGLRVQIKDIEFYQLRSALQKGTADVAISAIVATPERRRGMLFSSPYLQRSFVLVGRPGNRVGVASDSVAEGRADPEWELVEFQNRESLLRAYREGEIDSIFTGSADTLTYSKMPLLESYDFGESFSVMVPEGSEALLEKINAAIKNLESTGRLNQIRKRWLLG